MNESLGGKVAVITGAAHGIGRALALRAAAEGMRVALLDVDRAALDALASTLADGGTEVLARRVDVTDAGEVAEVAGAVEKRWGGVHVVCSNAGVATGSGVTWEVPAAEWQRVFAVNVFGALNMCQAFVPRMLARGEPGHVVITSSMLGLQAGPFQGAYCASKNAVTALGQSMAGELAALGACVTVSILCPGRVDTDMASRTPGDTSAILLIEHPLNVPVDPDHVAGVVFDGLRGDQAFLFTHAESPQYVRERAETILASCLVPS